MHCLDTVVCELKTHCIAMIAETISTTQCTAMSSSSDYEKNVVNWQFSHSNTAGRSKLMQMTAAQRLQWTEVTICSCETKLASPIAFSPLRSLSLLEDHQTDVWLWLVSMPEPTSVAYYSVREHSCGKDALLQKCTCRSACMCVVILWMIGNDACRSMITFMGRAVAVRLCRALSQSFHLFCFCQCCTRNRVTLIRFHCGVCCLVLNVFPDYRVHGFVSFTVYKHAIGGRRYHCWVRHFNTSSI